MEAAHPLLEDLAIVLCVAAVTTVVCQRLRQPVVLGYLLAGLIVGPHVPIPLVADAANIRTLAEIGVTLVMFSIGLEFHFRRLFRVLPTAGLTGVVQISLMTWFGYLVAQAFGWSLRERLYAGAMIAISSTMIVAAALPRATSPRRLTELVFGVLVIEDLAAVLMLALLTPIAAGGSPDAGTLGATLGRLAAFLGASIVLGILIVPRAIRAVARQRSEETLLLASIGVCFAFAFVSHRVGYSVALGAFLAGSLVAESGKGPDILHLTRPLRDLFAALFFVAIGMMVNPALVVQHLGAVAAFTMIVFVGSVGSVGLGAFLAGHDLRTSIQAGLTLAQIGEFSFIIVGAGVAAGAVGDHLLPVAVAVAVVTTFATPHLVRESGRIAAWVEGRLPRPILTFASFYGSWIEGFRKKRSRGEAPQSVRLVRLMIVDAALLAGIVIATATAMDWLAGQVSSLLGVADAIARGMVVLGAGATAAPFLVSCVRCARRLGTDLALAALPGSAPDRADLAAAPRRAMIVGVQLMLVTTVMAPLVAITQPFLRLPYGFALFAIVLATLGLAFWRSTTNLEQHVRAGAEVIVEALVGQAGEHRRRPTLDHVQEILPGFGALTPVELAAGSPAVGRTLMELNLRGLTGASVVAISRGGQGIVPSGREALEVGDVLALAGSQEAIASARQMLDAP